MFTSLTTTTSPVAFNSLSRDHWTPWLRRSYVSWRTLFQLPLSGSHNPVRRRLHAEQGVHAFQLPLSGSRYNEIIVGLSVFGWVFQLPLSGSQGVRKGMILSNLVSSFNSLSRDHRLENMPKRSAHRLADLSTPSLGITRPRHPVGWLLETRLSTPSLGITGFSPL